jgi:flagellar protein FliS
MSGTGSAAYRRVEIETASPAKLVVMLYNGAIKNAEEAKRAMGERDLATVHQRLIRAQEIVTELRSALNFGAGEVAENLERVYDYMYRLLVQANVEKSAAPIEECIAHLRSLRDAWEEVFLRVAREEQAAAGAAHNRHGHSVLNFEG